MNVMVVNKYKEMLMALDIDVMKSIEGVFNVDEIIDTFANFYYDKMILDITAIRDYQNLDNIQKLAMNINMEKVVLLLDNTPESESKTYLSKLISLGIYNFTKNSEGINYLLVHPHSYRDVVNIHNLTDIPQDGNGTNTTNVTNTFEMVEGSKSKIIGFKNVTTHAGATTLVFMLKKMLSKNHNIKAIEVNKKDFEYFNDPDLESTTSDELAKLMLKSQGYDLMLIDLNDYEDVSICTDVYYLLEPSTIMLNRLLKRSKSALDNLKDKKVVLNKCVLDNNDVATFEYETKIKTFCTICPFDERQNSAETLNEFINKTGI